MLKALSLPRPEFVDVLRRYGAAPVEDMEALGRRIVFRILTSNTDDHLRNHAFLYEGQNGWRLSPAYDLNPVPIDIKPRVLVTAIIEGDNTASLALAFQVAGYFEISTTRAREIAAEVAAVVSTWRAQAKRRGLSRREIDSHGLCLSSIAISKSPGAVDIAGSRDE